MVSMLIEGKTALVTGANRGLGRHLAGQLRDRGAVVYAAARNPETVDLPGVTPVALDVTDPASVAAAAAAVSDVSILVNNAGSSTGASFLTGDLPDIRLEMDTHFFGTLAVTRAFAPQLAAHDESAVLNVLSVLSWVSIPGSGAYCAAKSAEWSLTNALRLELLPEGTRVTALHVGYMDTDMTRHLEVPKSNPADIAKLAVDGIEAGDAEIVADDISRQILATLSAGVPGLYPQAA
jgi:NAD(P)-dependent dehydrogenase (short-subunit alcohol dehydrogenase family)